MDKQDTHRSLYLTNFILGPVYATVYAIHNAVASVADPLALHAHVQVYARVSAAASQ